MSYGSYTNSNDISLNPQQKRKTIDFRIKKIVQTKCFISSNNKTELSRICLNHPNLNVDRLWPFFCPGLNHLNLFEGKPRLPNMARGLFVVDRRVGGWCNENHFEDYFSVAFVGSIKPEKIRLLNREVLKWIETELKVLICRLVNA